jgi:hypothetical protein
MQLMRLVVALLSFLPLSAGAQQMSMVRDDLPPECRRCDWVWNVYVSERERFIVGPCEETFAAAREANNVVSVIDTGDLLLRLWSGLPFYRFVVPPGQTDCREIMKPALQWVYDVYLSSCLRQIPSTCAGSFPRP